MRKIKNVTAKRDHLSAIWKCRNLAVQAIDADDPDALDTEIWEMKRILASLEAI